MKNNSEIQELIAEITQKVAPFLKEGITYYSTPVKTEFGTSGGSVFYLENGKRCREQAAELKDALRNLPYRKNLFALTQTYPTHTKVKYTFRKGQTMVVEAYTPQMLLQEIGDEVKERLERRKAKRVEVEYDFFLKKKLKVNETERVKIGEKESTKTSSYVEDEVECFYYVLKIKLKKLHLLLENDKLSIHSSPALPELGISKIVDRTNLKKLDSRKLEPILEYLESGNEKKIARALEALKTNKRAYTKVQKRYLNLLQTRLNDPNATLEQFAEGMLNPVEVEALQGDALGDEFITFSYMDDQESKVVVDFIGAVVRNCFDLEKYIALAKKTKDDEEIFDLMEANKEEILKALEKQAQLYPEGWFSKVCKKLHGMVIEKVMFEKTSFDEANTSLVLKEFMFFLGLQNYDTVYFDIFQSDTPDLTEMFWLLPSVPITQWGDMEPHLPPSPLKYSRYASVKVNDDGDWKKIKSS